RVLHVEDRPARQGDRVRALAVPADEVEGQRVAARQGHGGGGDAGDLQVAGLDAARPVGVAQVGAPGGRRGVREVARGRGGGLAGVVVVTAKGGAVTVLPLMRTTYSPMVLVAVVDETST